MDKLSLEIIGHKLSEHIRLDEKDHAEIWEEVSKHRKTLYGNGDVKNIGAVAQIKANMEAIEKLTGMITKATWFVLSTFFGLVILEIWRIITLFETP